MFIYRIRVQCPDMKAQVDIQQIREVLMDSPGFSTADFDLGEQTINILSANQDGGKDVMFRLSHAGYPPSDFDVEELDAKTPERDEASKG